MGMRADKRYFVLGLGKSGTAVTRFLIGKGFKVVVHDDDGAVVQDAIDKLRDIAGEMDIAPPGREQADLIRCDSLIVSPGVPLNHPLVREARARRIEVTGELEVAALFLKSKIIGVTGTNGKSTVVNMIGDILQHAGVHAVVAGNIGTPVSSVVDVVPPYEYAVLEVSSFQLDTISRFRADIAVLLNITADHLDRYDNSLDKYAASKARIVNRANRKTVFVYNAADDACKRIAKSFQGIRIPFSSAASLREGIFVENGTIVIKREGSTQSIMETGKLAPVGVHNLENAMAAIGAVCTLDLPRHVIREALGSYKALPHRMELTRVVNGVTYINDSKATNVDATIKSIRSIDTPIVLIIGGLDKNGDYRPILHHLDKVKLVVLIGRAADKIERVLSGHCSTLRAADMGDAVTAARRVARSGDTVLLAPACASFDMFRSYAERGEAFRAAVNAL